MRVARTFLWWARRALKRKRLAGTPTRPLRHAVSERGRSSARSFKMESWKEREVEIEVSQTASIAGMVLPMSGGMEGMDHNFTEMLQDMLPKRKKRRTVSISEARRILVQDEMDRLIDMDEVVNEALIRAEDMGIVFLDEIDKIAGERSGTGPEVSREGVQRDILPIVEGSTVQTKYGLVRTDHVLFVAAGAFHGGETQRPDPRAAGTFPYSGGAQEPRRGGLHPYSSGAEKTRWFISTARWWRPRARPSISLQRGSRKWRDLPAVLNDQMENIGARRLHTVLTTLLESVLYGLPEDELREIVVDRDFVRDNLSAIVDDADLRRYIL